VEDGFPRQYSTLGTDGSVVMEMTFKNVNLKPDLDPAMFEYTPPEGVPVMDFMEMMQNMPDDAAMSGGKFEPGSPAPAFTGSSLSGDDVSLSDYEGKVVLLDFWATWCGPCVQELPNVIDAYQAYHDKGFEIIGISLDESQEDLESFLKDHPDMTWVQIFDGKGWDADIALQYEVEAIPFTLLLDRDGNVVHEGLRGEALSQALAELLGE
jgi:peroxiredoxin